MNNLKDMHLKPCELGECKQNVSVLFSLIKNLCQLMKHFCHAPAHMVSFLLIL